MRQLPYLPENESLTALVDLIANPQKFKERVKTLEDIQGIINGAIGDHNRIAKLDDLLAGAEAKVAEAGRIKADADKYVVDKTKEGDAYYDKQAARITAEDGALIERERSVAAREANVVKCQTDLDTKEKDLQKRELDIAKATVRAEQMTKEARILQDKSLATIKRVQSAAVAEQ